jgi:transcriptional regulator with XRE-family HTH domain
VADADGGAQELGTFLRSRRERMTPAEVGLPTFGRRRTPGLRREEVATLAGLSTTWYTYLEQGRGHDVSASVLDSVARVLRLSEDERRYMHNLAFGYVVNPRPLKGEVLVGGLLEQVVAIAESHPYPVYMVDHAANLIAWNTAAEEWYGEWGKLQAADRNFMVWLLTSPRAKESFVDWETVAHDLVARWRSDIARIPMDKLIGDRIYELHQKSREFAQWWGSREVREHRSAVRVMCHPRVGVLPLHVFPMTAYYDGAPLIAYHFPESS